MAQSTNPGVFGSHFNYVENHPMCADSALEYKHVSIFRNFCCKHFSSRRIYVIPEWPAKKRLKIYGTVLSAPLGRSNCTLKWRTNQLVIRNTLGHIQSNYSTALSLSLSLSLSSGLSFSLFPLLRVIHNNAYTSILYRKRKVVQC